MPAYRVEIPGRGAFKVESETELSPEQAFTLAQRQVLQQDYAKQADPLSGMGAGEKFLAGVGKGMTDLGRGAKQLVGKMSREEADAAKRTDAPLMGSGWGIAGNILGAAVPALPTAMIPGANTITGAGLLGAATGALQPVGTQDSRLMNVGTGAALGAGGQAAASGIGHLLRPVQSQLTPGTQQLARSAKAQGIPLDMADLTGSKPLKTIRSVLSELPLTADTQAATQEAKQQAFNRAVGRTFGAAETKLTPDVLQSARNRIGGQFNALSARNALNAEGTSLLDDLGRAQVEVNRFGVPEVARTINNRIDDLLSKVGPDGRIPGQAYREFDSAIGKTMRSTSNGDLRSYLGDVRNAVRGAMDQSISPADQAAWRQARQQYANMMTVAPVASKSIEGDVSGRGLLGAVSNAQKNSFPFGGGGELGDLGRIGRAFITDPTPNSGTAQRTFYQDMLMNPLAAMWRGGVGGVSLPVQAMLNAQNPIAQRYLSQGLIPITPAQQRLMNMAGRGLLPAVPWATNAEEQ